MRQEIFDRKPFFLTFGDLCVILNKDDTHRYKLHTSYFA